VPLGRPRVERQQLLRELAHPPVVVADVGERQPLAQHVGRLRVEVRRHVEQAFGLVELAAAQQHAGVLAQQLDVLGIKLERGQDRGLCPLQLAQLLVRQAQHVQQRRRVGLVLERVARRVRGRAEVLDAEVGERAHQPALNAAGGLAVEAGQHLERALGPPDLDVALGGAQAALAGRVAHDVATARQ
jgi:hypothetical protein